MAMKQPIILGGSDDLHVPLAGGDTLDPSVLTISNDAGSLLVNSPTDGLAAFLTTQNSPLYNKAMTVTAYFEIVAY